MTSQLVRAINHWASEVMHIASAPAAAQADLANARESELTEVRASDCAEPTAARDGQDTLGGNPQLSDRDQLSRGEATGPAHPRASLLPGSACRCSLTPPTISDAVENAACETTPLSSRKYHRSLRYCRTVRTTHKERTACSRMLICPRACCTAGSSVQDPALTHSIAPSYPSEPMHYTCTR